MQPSLHSLWHKLERVTSEYFFHFSSQDRASWDEGSLQFLHYLPFQKGKEQGRYVYTVYLLVYVCVYVCVSPVIICAFPSKSFACWRKLAIRAFFCIEDTFNLALPFTLDLCHRLLIRLPVVAISKDMKQMSEFQYSYISF